MFTWNQLLVIKETNYSIIIDNYIWNGLKVNICIDFHLQKLHLSGNVKKKRSMMPVWGEFQT